MFKKLDSQLQASTQSKQAEAEQLSNNITGNPIHKLHHAVGNQAVQSLFRGGQIQAKLEIGEVDDKYEKEADENAEKIVSTPHKLTSDRLVVDSNSSSQIRLSKISRNTSANLDQHSSGDIRNLQGGQPLTKAERGYFEPRFGADLSSVRLHNNTHAAILTSSINAKAFAYKNNIVFANHQYQFSTMEGKRLLAHELTHVMQQGQIGARVQRVDDEFEPPPADMTVTMSGVTFSVREPLVFTPGQTRFRAMAVILKRLLGPQYTRGMQSSVLIELDAMDIVWTGILNPDSRVAVESSTRGLLILDPPTAMALIGYLKQDLQLQPQINEEQEGLLMLGVSAMQLFSEIEPLLPDWYSQWLFDREMSQNVSLLERYQQSMEENVTDEERENIRIDVYSAVTMPADLLETIRNDIQIYTVRPSESDDPLERANNLHAPAAYAALWDIDMETTPNLSQSPPPEKGVREDLKWAFLRFVRSQPQLSTSTQAEQGGHQARVTLLGRFARIAVRAMVGTTNEEALFNSPPTTNSPPWPARMTNSPPLQPPLFQAVIGTDHRFSMQLHFQHFTDAFVWYAYLWERIRIPDPPELSEQEQAGDSANAPATGVEDLQNLSGETPSAGEVFDVRMNRARRYNQADIERIQGPLDVLPGVGARDLVELNNMLRISGAVARIGLERLTMPRSDTQVVFPEPGIYVVRCRAVPILEGDEEIVRAPSVAYQPVLAMDPEELLMSQIQAIADTRLQVQLRIAEIREQLDRDIPPENASELSDEMRFLQSQLMEPGEALSHRRRELTEEKSRAQRRLAIRRSIREVRQRDNQVLYASLLAELRSQLVDFGGPGNDLEDERLVSQLVNQLEDINNVISSREERNREETALREVIMTSFVSDMGHSISLSIELFDHGVVDNDVREIFISDFTTTRSGVGTGRVSHSEPLSDEARQQATEAAFLDLLESSSDYGRGHVAYRLNSQNYRIRVEAGEGRIFSEAIESGVTVLSIAAIAAAPFTGGQSLYLLIPLGAVGALPSAYRIYNRVEASTFRWFDLDMMMDIANIVGGIIGLAHVATPLRMVRMGRFLMIMGFGADGTGILLMGAGMVQQMQALQSLPEGERAARMLEILAGAFLQMGIQAGGMLASARYRSSAETQNRDLLTEGDTPGFHPPSEGTTPPHSTSRAQHGETQSADSPAPTTRGQEVASTNDAAASAGDRTSGSTRGPTTPAPQTPPGASSSATTRARATQTRDQVLSRLESGVEALPPPLPRDAVVQPPESHSTYRRGLHDADAAYQAYGEALAISTGREVALYQNPHTGEFIIQIGDEVSVRSPRGESGVHAVVHYHPNLGNVLTFRLPAPADFRGLLFRFMADGGHVREFVESHIPGVGRARTEFGINPAHPNEPFYVTINRPDAPPQTLRFANDVAYGNYWGSRTRMVEPGSPEHGQIRADMDTALRDVMRRRSEEQQARPADSPASERVSSADSSSNRTSGSVGQGATNLLAGDGTLTAQGISFIKDNVPTITEGTGASRRVRDVGRMTDAEIQRLFLERPAWLEKLVVAEARAAWLQYGGDATIDFFIDTHEHNYNFRTLKNRFNAAITNGGLSYRVNESILNEFTAHFVQRLLDANHPVLKPAYDAAMAQVGSRFHEFLWQEGQGTMGGFMLGRVGDKRFDIIEVRLSQDSIAITDSTFAYSDPIHNFKSAFYLVVVQNLIDVGNVTSTDFRGPMRQTPIGP